MHESFPNDMEFIDRENRILFMRTQQKNENFNFRCGRNLSTERIHHLPLYRHP